MEISKRNYEDFLKEISNVRCCLSSGFRDMSVDDLEQLYNKADSLLSEFDHLNGDIENMFDIIENIEE